MRHPYECVAHPTEYCQEDRQKAFLGDHYTRLLQLMERYDPDDPFCIHDGVGTGT